MLNTLRNRMFMILCLTASLLSIAPGHASGADVLTQGVTNSKHYGFRWNAPLAHRDRVEFTFKSDSTFPLALAVRGYDIDTDREVRVVLNGQSLGFLSKGISDRQNATADVFTLPANLLNQSKANSLVFEQAVKSGWKWGVTDLIIDSENKPNFARPLITGVPERQRFGWGFWGAEKRYRAASYSFSGGDNPLAISARGFDIDKADEVMVLINGESVGFLSPSADMRIYPVPNQFTLPVADQRTVNTLTFLQTSNRGWVWGVTDVLVEPVFGSNDEPSLGAARPVGAGSASNAYGWNYPGAEAYLEAVELSIQTETPQELELQLRGFDIDFDDEVYVSVGSTLIGFLERGRDGALSAAKTRLVIPEQVQTVGNTIVRIGQARQVGYTWGVTDISIEPVNGAAAPIQADATLNIDSPASGRFGWQWAGAQQSRNEAKLHVPINAEQLESIEGIDIELTGYDIDDENEVEVLFNGISLGFLHPTPDGEVNECFDLFFVPISLVRDIAIVGRYKP